MRTWVLTVLFSGAALAQNAAQLPPELSADGSKSASRGIDWLLKVQSRAGYWGEDEGCSSDVACTAIAGLAILSSGETARDGKHRDAVRKATRWLTKEVLESRQYVQKTPSSISNYLGAYIHEYLACAFLAESVGMQPNTGAEAGQDDVHEALRKLVHRIEARQDNDGSWNDGIEPLNTTAIAYMALRAAHNSGITIRRASLDKTISYVERRVDVRRKIVTDPNYGERKRFTSTAGALRVLLGQGRTRTKEADVAISLLREIPFGRDYGGEVSGEDFFGGVLGAHAMLLEEGDAWREVFTKIEKVLVGCQNADGSWTGHHCISARVFCTGCAVVTLETPLRLLPMTQL